jgi:hypothetical protein
VSQKTGMPLELLRAALASMGFASVAPDDRIREDELEIVPLLQLGHATGVSSPHDLTDHCACRRIISHPHRRH